MERKEDILGTKGINKLLFSMGFPIMCSMLVQAFYNIVDIVFVAQINENAFEAVNLVFPIQNLMISIAVGTSIGMNALLSRKLGEKNYEDANTVANTGIFLGLFSAVITAIFGIFGSEWFMKISSDNPEVIKMGTSYLQICTLFSVGLFMQITFERIIQVTGKTVYQMTAQLTGAIINIILDPILIFGIGPFAKMGITGAAVATVIGQWIGMTLIITLNKKYNKEVKIYINKIRFHKETAKGIYKVGLPSIIMNSIGSVTVFGMNQILRGLSESAVNVLGSFFKLQSFVFMPIFGFTSAFIPIIGYNYGAKNKERIVQAVRSTTIASMSIMAFGMVVFWIFPELLLGFFNPTKEVIDVGIPALRIISTSFISAGLCIVFSCCFQALGNGMLSLYMSVTRQLVVILPVAYILAGKFGVTAVWWAYPVAECASLTLAIIFFRKMYKEKIAVLNKM